MPQIQSGQVDVNAAGAPKLYGVDKPTNTVPFQQKLMDRFKATEFVMVKNIDSEPVYWQYQPIDSEQEYFDESGIQKMIVREKPEMWVIMPGETEVLIGASAYRCLDVMYKNCAAHKTLNRYKDPTGRQFDEAGAHLPKNFNFADAGAQDDFINQAYLGKAMPTFGNAQPVVEAPQPANVVNHPVQSNGTINGFAPQGDSNPPIQPMQPAAPVANIAPADDPTIPKPKTTEGVPLGAVTYADPNNDGKPGILSVATSDHGPVSN